MESLESNFRTLLTFGKFIGLYPTKKIGFRIIRIIPIILGFNAIIDFIGVITGKEDRRAASQFFKEIGTFCFYLTGTFVYTYFHTKTGKLNHLMEEWLKLESQSKKDETLRRFSDFVTITIYTSAILENIVYHFKLFPFYERSKEQEKLEGNLSSLETYYRRSHSHWAKLVPYSPVQAVILIITNKLALYAWNFMDLFLIVMSRALQFKFANLLESPGSRRWLVLRERCIELVEMLSLFEDFLSPLIFTSYAMNMYALCMQLSLWFTPSENTNYLHSLYSIWSFVHLLVRMLLISVQAAKVNENARRLEREVQECPDNEFSLEIGRMESFTKAKPRGYGLSGLGCFIVTKRFILSMFSIAFTFEVFLLQADQADVVQ